MNPFARIMGDGKKSRQMKYEIDWNAQTIEPVSFAGPVHDSLPVKKSLGSQIPEVSISQPKLEKGTIDLSKGERKDLFKKQEQPLKRVSFSKQVLFRPNWVQITVFKNVTWQTFNGYLPLKIPSKIK